MAQGCAWTQGLTTSELSQGPQDPLLSPLRHWSSERVCDLPEATQQVCLGGRPGPGFMTHTWFMMQIVTPYLAAKPRSTAV